MFSADLGVNQVASNPPATDPPFQKVALLLHGDGTNGAQNNTFVDSSSNNFTITRTGNVAQGTFSPFSLAEGQWSNYFDGSGDTITAADNSAFAAGTGDFTLEFWMYSTDAASSQRCIYDTRATAITSAGGFFLRTNSTNELMYGRGTSPYAFLTVSGRVNNAWQHVALVRSSGTVTIYLNGVSAGSVTDTTNLDNQKCRISGFVDTQAAGYAFLGYLSNVRFVKGTAVYTSNFTPSTTPLTAISGTSLLTCQSNRFKDNSSNNFTITPTGDTKVTAFSPFAPSAAYSAGTNGGSGYFDGAGDYLTTSSVTFAGDFTVEGWLFIANFSAGRTWVQIGDDVFASGPAFYVSTAGKFAIYAGSALLTGSATIAANTWVHLAVCRSGSTVKSYVNGVLDATITNSTTFTGAVRVGAEWYNGTLGGAIMNGYISNLRLVTGTAVYTSNFTPPTAPLTAVTNTSLLCNMTNAGIIDNSGKNDIETVGNAQISTSVKKYGTGSMYFDGSGDYLVSPTNDVFNFGTGDFTVEGWINTTSLASEQSIFDCTPLGGSGRRLASFVLVLATTGALRYYSSDAYSSSTSNTITTGSWFHFAMVRASGVIKIYINGTQGLSVANTTSFTASGCVIGRYADAASGYMNGYIDDLRITKGQALYTSNFTPPTQAFPNF